MKVDVLIVLISGLVQDIYVVEDTKTAEVTFDSIAKDLLADDYKYVITQTDYGEKLIELNNYNSCRGIEVIWHTRVNVNTYKNE